MGSSSDEQITRLSAELSALQELLGVLEQATFEQTKRLKESEALQKAILEAAPDCILTLNETGEVESANGVLEPLFGCSFERLQQEGTRLLFRDLDVHATFVGMIEDALRGDGKQGVASVLELRGVRANGENVPLSVSVRAVGAPGRGLVTAFLRDISELKRVDTMKNEFISTVSHELRTPLTSIVGSVQLILGGVTGTIHPEAKALLEIAERNGRRLTLLISDILDIDKIESGNLVFDFATLNIEKLTREVVDDNQIYAARYGVELEFQSTASAIDVRVDPARFGQVVANLLSNAIKFSPRGRRVRVRIDRHGALVRLSVADHGPGIPDALHQRIFDRFAQVDSSDTRRFGGTGLGLNIARSIVQRMGARISLESEVGRGTTFFVDFPCVDAMDPTDQLVRQGSGRLPVGAEAKPPRILVCEDEEPVSAVLARLLERAGYVVDVADSASAAKSLLAEKCYSAMTLDLELPDQHGIALLQELRAEDETRHLPVVIVSGTAGEADDEVDYDALEIVDWQPKPIDSRRLAEVLEQTVASEPRVLYVEDDADLVSVVRSNLAGIAEVHGATTVGAARELLRVESFDVVLLDLNLGEENGLELLPLIQELMIPLVIYSAHQVDSDLANRVAATLVKSRTTPARLAEVVAGAIRRSLAPTPPT